MTSASQQPAAKPQAEFTTEVDGPLFRHETDCKVQPPHAKTLKTSSDTFDGHGLAAIPGVVKNLFRCHYALLPDCQRTESHRECRWS
jgi:hypothetical protein